MAQELEIKYRAGSPEQLAAALTCEAVESLRYGDWEEIPMQTTYYDTPSRALAARLWTFRLRVEDGRRVLCLKTPSTVRMARNEYETETQRIDAQALNRLCQAGAPEEIFQLADPAQLRPVCGAKFLRRVARLRMPDGSTAAISGDVGILHGTEQEEPLCEMELELTSGAPDLMLQFAHYLAKVYGLLLERRSKFSRARRLQ